ncbi:MAG TPA: VOC family protein [Stellaceae bacterium]|nr:VOC family protein [Stellaceae bacterium]
MLRPKALDHVGLIVTDMERSRHFYEALGAEFVRYPRRPGGATVLKIGGMELNVFGNAAVSANTAQLVDHLCFEMDCADMADLLAGLSEAGIEVARGPLERSDGTAVFVHDPDGTRIELLVKDGR